jgi:hypothetical protein
MSDLSRFPHPRWGALLLTATVLLTASAEAASHPVTAGDIFWVNPGASPARLCRAMLSPLRDEPGSVPFCQAFRQYQVIAVVGAQAQIGIETWIRLEDPTNPALLLRFDPATHLAASRRQAAGLAPYPSRPHSPTLPEARSKKTGDSWRFLRLGRRGGRNSFDIVTFRHGGSRHRQ